jgi:hypothetical protein
MRGGAALTTVPNVASLMFPSTQPLPSNWVWLKVLNVSKRNSRDLLSVNFVTLSDRVGEAGQIARAGHNGSVGPRVNEILTEWPFTSHVNVGFFHGATPPDPDGTGKCKRHLQS